MIGRVVRFAALDHTPLDYDTDQGVIYERLDDGYWHISGPEAAVRAMVDAALEAYDLNACVIAAPLGVAS